MDLLCFCLEMFLFCVNDVCAKSLRHHQPETQQVFLLFGFYVAFRHVGVLQEPRSKPWCDCPKSSGRFSLVFITHVQFISSPVPLSIVNKNLLRLNPCNRCCLVRARVSSTVALNPTILSAFTPASLHLHSAKYLQKRCTHMTAAKVFCIFFPDFQKNSLNSAIVCRHQKSNLQICKFLTSATYHVNPSTNPHNLLLFTYTTTVPIVQ